MVVRDYAGQPREPDPFYRVAEAFPAGSRNGEVLRAEPLKGAPSGASAFRVLYQSTGLDGQPIAVSGVIIIPRGSPPAGGRNVVAWAHPTTGVSEGCAPSLDPGFFNSVPGLRALLARGFVVTATDYPGLGTPGPHPYLVGVSEGRAVLDSVRAAHGFPPARAGSRFAVWGHSQGGQAALYVGQEAASYAPELELVGLAMAAPATELATLLQRDLSTEVGKIIASYLLWSWSRVYRIALDPIVAPPVIPVIEQVSGDCAETVGEVFRVAVDTLPLWRQFLLHRFDEVEPWRSLLAQNTPGQTRAGAPLFISQGQADRTVRPDVTARFVEGLRRHGERVRFVKLPGVGHFLVGRISAPLAVRWIRSRFAGMAAPDGDLPL